MKKLVFFMLLFAICIVPPNNIFSGSKWDIFLNQPNNSTLKKLEKAITESKDKCTLDVMPSQLHRKQIFKLIDKGNQQALQAALLVFECFDGGDLEDFYRSSGTFFELKPCVFLKILTNNHIADSQIKYFFIMLPLSTVDNINLKISMIEKRIKMLNEIKEENVKEIKQKGLSFLKDENNFLKKIKAENEMGI